MDMVDILEKATQVVGVLSIIATVTPTPKDDVILVVLRKLLNFGAMNFGQSENKVKPGEFRA